jgi:hypothetical protein
MKEPREAVEALISFVLVMCIFVSIPLSKGGIGLSWDAFNHHIYLGWVANEARFDKDYFAAGSQSYQFPYLYWPIYKMAINGWDGLAVGLIWASLHGLVSFPLWRLTSKLIPGDTMEAALFRQAGVLFGIGGLLVLRAPETTANDLIAALPIISAFALVVEYSAAPQENTRTEQGIWRAALVGGLGGIASAFKLSNAVLAVLIPCACLFWRLPWRSKMLVSVTCALSTLVWFVIVYGWWGWQLWEHFGNPIFPFAENIFRGVRESLSLSRAG